MAEQRTRPLPVPAAPDPRPTPGGARAGRKRWRWPHPPARVRIMGWVLLLMFCVLAVVNLATMQSLRARVDEHVNSALEQESREFVAVARGGVDRATGERFAGIEELVFNHVQRQFPDDDEVIFGVVRDGAGQRVLRQDRPEPFVFSQDPALVAQVLGSNRAGGTLETAEGHIRWVLVNVTDPQGDPDATGAYVVGYLVERDLAEVNDTMRTLVLVSAAGLVLAGVGAWLVSGQILAPVRLVRQTAAEITERDLTRRIPIHGNDDITVLAEQFNAMLDRLAEAFAAQRQFVDDASHELRTPITIVRGHLELMGDDPAERAATVRLVTDELDRMSRIVEDLLLLAKSRRPDFVQPQRVPVVELTSDIDAKVRALGDRRWVLESIGEGFAVVDPQRVTQAMVQLAQNAVTHTRPGDRIAIGSALRPGTVSFWVTDTGPGVRAEDREAIFERFARGTNDRSRGHGAGLGLAIVRAIAEAHGGSVTLVSRPGEGATFRLELPAGTGSGGPR